MNKSKKNEWKVTLIFIGVSLIIGAIFRIPNEIIGTFLVGAGFYGMFTKMFVKNEKNKD